MYQVLQAILNDPKDTTRVRLIYANVTEEVRNFYSHE